MSSANVLPSAPELYPMAEISQINAEDLRLKKISDLLKELSDEAQHYRQVAKKYKRTHSIVHSSAVGLGSLSVGLSSGALATALTRFGIVASPALAVVATVCGLSSVGFAAASKRLERKVTKHEKIYTLALAKRNSVNELVSKALTDKSAMLSSASSPAKWRNTTNSRLQSQMARQKHKRQQHKHRHQTSRNSKTNFAMKSNKSSKKRISLLTEVSKSDLKD